MENTRYPITKRLEIALLFAGLVGIFLIWSGVFLPWALVEAGEDGEVLIALSGFNSLLVGKEGARITNPIVIFALLAPIPCYVFILLVQRNSKGAAGILIVTGLSIILQTIMWIVNVFPIPDLSYTYHRAYIISIGVYTTMTGGLFTTLAGLLSILRIRLIPAHLLLKSRRIRFETYVIKRFLVFVVTSIGVTLVIFWILSQPSPEQRGILYIWW